MLNKIIGKKIQSKKLQQIYIQSFYIGEELIEKYNALFFKINDTWLHITVSENEILCKDCVRPHCVKKNKIKDLFKYPIQELKNNDILLDFKEKKIILVQQIVGDRFGLSLQLENDIQIKYFEKRNGKLELKIELYKN